MSFGAQAQFSSDSYTPDSLIVSLDGAVARPITIASGNTVTRGAVLGKITVSGKYIKSLSAASDGSQTPDCILVDDCDASGGDKTALAYFTGQFNSAAVGLGTAHTVASVREGLRGKGIHLIDQVQ